MIGAVGGWWFGACALFMIVCMLFMMPMMTWHRDHSDHGDHRSFGAGEPDPERTLANRLASGEIDADEYERLRATIDRSRSSAHT